MNTLRQAAQKYLNLRRSLGYKLYKAGKLLPAFVKFMEEHRAFYITTQLALAWAQQPSTVQPTEWAKRLSIVRLFAGHRSATDPRTQIPPRGLLPYRPKRAQPYLYRDKEKYGAYCVRRFRYPPRWTATLDIPLPVGVTERHGYCASAKRAISSFRMWISRRVC